MDQAPRFEHQNWLNIVYASQFMRFLSAKGFPGQSLLDIGAHKARWSQSFKDVFPDAHVFMIEPLEEMRPFLDKFCQSHSNSKYILAGAGPQPGHMEFTIWPGLSGSSFVPERGHSFYDTYAKRIVPIVTIDDLVAQQGLAVPDVTKLDVQGFELEVLRGASRIMGKTELFFLEVSFFNPLGPKMPLFHEVVKFMHDRGYVPYDITGFYRRRKDHALAQCDMVFVREDSHLRDFTGLVREFAWDYTNFKG